MLHDGFNHGVAIRGVGSPCRTVAGSVRLDSVWTVADSGDLVAVQSVTRRKHTVDIIEVVPTITVDLRGDGTDLAFFGKTDLDLSLR